MTSSTSKSTGSVSKAKQKHVTTACVNCRTRKIKCDAATPTCSNCTLYSQHCVYQHGLDKRKIPMKERYVALENYTRQLEDLLRANGIPLPNEGGPPMLPNAATLPASPGEQIPSMQAQQYSLINGFDIGFASEAAPATFHSPPPDASSSPLVDQLASSMGTLQIAEDGQLRFYGATSNLHLLVNGMNRQSNGITVPTADDIQATLDAAGVGHFVDPELEEHLIKLYFCWEDPSIHFVQEEIFYRERKKCKTGMGPSRFYSEVLVNAMCAVGASLTSRHCVNLPEPLVEFFSLRARALLDVELDSPTLSTVQSLGILSGVESIRTNDARGWLYSGMAARLATDLGLHLEHELAIDAGIIDAEEAALRGVLFWGVFIHERMWSLYLGRPVSLDEKFITTPTHVITNNEPKYWQPYEDEHEDFDFPPLPNHIDELHGVNATLCAKMTRIRETLYSDLGLQSPSAQILYDFASSMRSELLQWQSELPDMLHVDLSSVSTFYVPHVLQLHMQYHTIMILVNRPFFSASAASIPHVAFTDPMVGRPACTESAKALSKLLQIYRRLYSFRRINIQAVHLIFTASLIHVLNACEATEPSLKNSAWKDLEVCCQALSEMGKGYKNATRALDVVNGIKSELLKATRESTKRVSFSASGNMAKRRRPSALDDVSSVDPTESQDNPTLYSSTNPIDSIFWSEVTSLELPGF